MARIILFSHVAFACKDLSATEAFYTKHFGFRQGASHRQAAAIK